MLEVVIARDNFGSAVGEEGLLRVVWFFFFQAEDGIRDLYVTGVQTCALPISSPEGEGLAKLLPSPSGEGPGEGLNTQRTPPVAGEFTNVVADVDASADKRRGQIGRASCRERV